MFLMDIQRDQVDGVRAFLADPAHGAGPSRLIPVLRARVTGVERARDHLESFEDVRARGSLAREYTITYRDALEPNERIVDGAFWNGPVDRAGGVGRAGHARAVPDRRRRHDAVRHPRPDRSARGSRASATWSGATRAAAASCSCSGRACSSRRRRRTSRRCKGPADADGARAVPARPRRAVSQRVGHRLPRDPRRRCAT